MHRPIENTGFTPPAGHRLGNERRTTALAELIASLGLALATIVVVTVVSAGIARAEVVDGVIGNEGSIFAVAFLLGLAFIGIGGLTLPGKPKRH